MRPEIRIATPRLLLRPPRAADRDAIVAGIGDMAVAGKLAVVPYPYGPADAEHWLGRIGGAIAAGTDILFMIVRDGDVIGSMGIHHIPRINELGYWLARAHWGNGYATEAGEAVLAYCFDELRLPRLRSGVFADNPASLRVQAKLGFRRIGISQRPSLARGHTVPHIDTILTRRRHKALAR